MSLWAIMLNNRAKKNSQFVLDSLNIFSGAVIADIGSGGGYFALEFARRTGLSGKVFAVDTNQALLAYVEKATKKKRLKNIEMVIGHKDGCPLPKESCDLIFMRNVFHHIENPVSYFQKLRESVKPGGRIAIIDWNRTTRGYVGYAGHSTPEAEIQRIMREAGFKHMNSYGFLKGQSFNLFQKDDGLSCKV